MGSLSLHWTKTYQIRKHTWHKTRRAGVKLMPEDTWTPLSQFEKLKIRIREQCRIRSTMKNRARNELDPPRSYCIAMLIRLIPGFTQCGTIGDLHKSSYLVPSNKHSELIGINSKSYQIEVGRFTETNNYRQKIKIYVCTLSCIKNWESAFTKTVGRSVFR